MNHKINASAHTCIQNHPYKKYSKHSTPMRPSLKHEKFSRFLYFSMKIKVISIKLISCESEFQATVEKSLSSVPYQNTSLKLDCSRYLMGLSSAIYG